MVSEEGHNKLCCYVSVLEEALLRKTGIVTRVKRGRYYEV